MTKRKKDDRGETKANEAAQLSLPLHAVTEGVLAVVGGGLGGRPIHQAQELIYQAWVEPSAAGRVALARQALEISGDCADAYVILAEQGAANVGEAIELLRKGVAAGERALGKRAFKADVGMFWGLVSTRPYMRARADLAHLLRETGQHEEAVAHYRDLLRLNPEDNQGLRYALASCLLDRGDDDDLAGLLDAYPDDGTATWAYSAALLAFRRHGSGRNAGPLLAGAKKTNPHVPAYLLGRKKVPTQLPDYMGVGDESEAMVYANSARAGWKKTPGALDWLRSSLGPMPTKKRGTKATATWGAGSSEEAVLIEIRRRAAAGRALNSGANRGDWLYAAAVRFCGSWGDAVAKAGFDYGASKTAALSADEVLGRIRRLASDGGTLRAGDHPIVASGARRHFGGWTAAVEAAGCERPGYRWTKAAVVAAVRADLAAGLPVNAGAVVRRNGKLYGAGRRRFGTWEATLAAAQAAIPPGPRGRRARR